ncbi:hypothetical protein BDV95DRAFT_602247 [Massariosphaeria phaeospora]|uniref:Transcription factor domain-containing protein n=1 Tax=Massariosphaeria phaeospora TaxID=100035 RepID=A0A7C8MIF6_9PLEO|nr:hypothetical protein BDV95DRAFT_602247 [Massariosphaeria phaeospora]
MTKPAGTPRKQPEPRNRVVKSKYPETRSLVPRDHGVLTPLHASPTTSLRNDIGVAASSPANGWPTPPTPPESSTRATQNRSNSAPSFYLGSTSYASVFAEEQPLPNSLHEQPAETIHATPSVLPSRVIGSRHCQMGIGHSILSKLSPFSLIERLITDYFENFKFKASLLVGPLVMSALPQLRVDLEHLAALDNPSPAYAEITKNTARPLKVPSTMLASTFHTLFTGRNLRWETLGLMLIVAGSNAQFTSPDDPMFTLDDGKKLARDEFIEDMIHASNDCISLCQVHGAVNDIMVWMIYNNMIVTSNFYGDNYHGVWRRMSDCISTLYAEGIHCEQPSEPFFLRESRRRIYAGTYRSDKTLATFFGRPPMMAHRYSDRGQPLDLDDNIIASDDPEVVNEALSRLDHNGWNTNGEIWSASWVRLRWQLSCYKEQFLDQSLAGRTGGDVVHQLQEISVECRRCWESFPAHLRYDLYNEDVVWSTRDSGTALRMISAYIEYLHMEFQFQRVLRRQTQLAVPALLETSMKLLSTVLVINKQRTQDYGIRRHFPTIILFHCLPGAGVLALELRRCTLENVPLPSTVRRADLIRNLSVLISCLEWVILPGDGNHKLCGELNKMLAMVLDEVLNYEGPSVNVEDLDSFFDIPSLEGVEPIPTQSEDFLDWLDNANWDNLNWNTTCIF